MVSVTDLRAGTVFQLDGRPLLVLEYKHTKMGRGTANIKVKVRDLESDGVLEKTFISGAKVELIDSQIKELQYLYRQGDEFFFLDPITFGQVSLGKDILEGVKEFLKEGLKVKVMFWQERPLSVELANSLTYEIKETDPGAKGNSATNVFKPAILDNGLLVKVPLFIKIGEKVRVDTRTGEYIERAKS